LWLCPSRFSLLPRPRAPSSTLFPYTTLFRSLSVGRLCRAAAHAGLGLDAHRGPVVALVHALLDDIEPVEEHRNARGQQDDKQHQDRKSTRLNSSHVKISYAVFCLKKKHKQTT